MRNAAPVQGSREATILPGDKARKHTIENFDKVEYERVVIDQIHRDVDNVAPMILER